MTNVEDDGVDQPLLEQPFDFLDRSTQPDAAGPPGVSTLDRAACLAPRVKYWNDWIHRRARANSGCCCHA
jgi:hypothetical protein